MKKISTGNETTGSAVLTTITRGEVASSTREMAETEVEASREARSKATTTETTETTTSEGITTNRKISIISRRSHRMKSQV